MSNATTHLGSEQVAVCGVIDPDAHSTGAQTTGWVDASEFNQFMAIVFAGTLVSTATLDAKIEQATTSGGGSAKDLTGSAITQLTQAGSDSDKQAVINFSSTDLDVDNNFRYVRLSVTLGTAGGDIGGVLLGLGPRFGPASDNDASTVDEIVTV